MYTPTPEDLVNMEILNKWVAWLRGEMTIKTKADIANSLDVSRATVSCMLTGKARISDKFMNRFAAVYLTPHGLRWSDYEEIKGKKKDIEYATLQAMMEEILEQNKQILALLQKK